MRKYFLYAIGEIALVMIGILLALQINNWNQNRKDNLAKEEALIDLHQEFTTLKEDFDRYYKFIIEVQGKWDDYLTLVTNPNLSYLDSIDYRPRSASRLLAPKLSTLESILSTGKIDRIENKELKSALTGWAAVFADYEVVMRFHDEFYRNEMGAAERHLFTIFTIPGSNKFKFPDYDKTEALQAALEDKHYQNLLLTQFALLNLKVQAAPQLQKEIYRIIYLLENEMKL